MQRVKELRMTAIILLVGVFLLSGCFFSSKHEVTFKTNGGSEVKSASVKSGNKLDVPKTPTKEGYVFEGWFLNGKEYNFEDEVSEDITLVAKWRKVEVDGEGENEENKEPDDSDEEITTSLTTKKVTTKKATASGTVKTTKKNTTKKTTRNTTTKNTTTSTTTKKVVEQPTAPIKPTEPTPEDPSKPEEPIVPEKKELKMNITITEENGNSMLIETKDSDILETIKPDEDKNIVPPVEVKKNYNLVIDVNSNDVNTISNLKEEDLNEFLSSEITKWQINNQRGEILKLKITDTKISSDLECEISAITIKNENKAYVITFDDVKQKWILDYPSVRVTSEDKVMHYANLNDAVGTAVSGDKVEILRDLNVIEEVIIDKAITIDGGDFKINSSSEYLFSIQNINDETKEIVIANMEVKVKSLLCVEELKVKTITIENIRGSYSNKIMDNSSWLEIVENNLKLDFLEFREDNLTDEKTL